MKGKGNELKGEGLRDQRERQKAGEDLSSSYCVEAGAGTGKTTVLIARVLGLLLDKGLSPGEVVAITFTEKAAGELRLRLRDALEVREDPRAREALEELDRMQIGTIHGFAASLLRERPIEAKVTPGFEVLDSVGSQLLFDQVWDRWIERELSEPSAVFSLVARLGLDLFHLRLLARFLNGNRGYHGREPQGDLDSILERVEALLHEGLQRLRDLACCCVNPEDKGFQEIERLGRICEQWQLLDREGRACLLLSPLRLKNVGNQKNWDPKTTMAQVKALLAEMDACLQREAAILSDRVCAELLDWLRGFVEEIQREKRRQGALDFDDLLHRARVLLRDPLVLERFQKAYQAILVDEVQDTDATQLEIVFRLCEKGGVLAPGKLFLVGDPKQSIYRFRRADLNSFVAARDRLEREGGLLRLEQNFRSASGVVDWVNRCFASLLKGGKVPFFPLVPYRTDCPGRVEVLLPREGSLDEKSPAQVVREEEARHIAARIRKGVREKEWRWGDVAVLFRSSTGLELYERAFQALEVPYITEAGGRFHYREEVVGLRNALVCVERPHDPCALVSCLRSPFFGVSDEALYMHRKAGCPFHVLLGRESPVPSIRDALELLADLHQRRHDLGVARTVEEFLENTRGLALWLVRTQGEQSEANCLKLLEMARAFERQEGATFGRFCRWLQDVDWLQAAESESPILEPGEDAVSMMTVHKAKGLEFPVVILANLASGFWGSESCLVDRNTGHLELRIPSKPWIASSGFESLMEREKEETLAEEIRILYVAATRAKDVLILPRFPGKSKQSLLSFLEGTGQLESGEACSVPGEVLDLEGADPSLLRIKLSHQGARGHESRRTAWIEKRKAALEHLAPKTRTERSAEGHSARIGKALHRAMEIGDWENEKTWRGGVSASCQEFGVPNQLEEVLRMMETLMATSTLSRARQADFCHREAPFVLMGRDGARRGIIDLLFREGDGLVVVDYKTGGGPLTEETRRRFQAQAAFYSEAGQSLVGVPVLESIFLSASTGQVLLSIAGDGFLP